MISQILIHVAVGVGVVLGEEEVVEEDGGNVAGVVQFIRDFPVLDPRPRLVITPRPLLFLLVPRPTGNVEIGENRNI